MSLLVVVPACAHPIASGPGVRSPQAEGSDLTRQQQQDLRFFESILQNASVDLETRIGAAERLIVMDVAGASAVLDHALRSGDTTTMQPVIRAMTLAPAPVPGLVDAAVDALRTSPPETLKALAAVVASYGTAALPPVVKIALDGSLPVVERLGAIRALGAFPTRESGDRLIELADPRRGEDEMIRTTAFASLRRLAPADLGDDHDAWSRWWQTVRNQSPEQWARELVGQYQKQNAELVLEITRRTEVHVELLREYYKLIPVARQLEELPTHLADDPALVREFAMDRVGRLLRDSVQIPEAIRTLLISRLDDLVPALRLRAAGLLDELDEGNLGELVGARLAGETDRTVIAGYLELLARHPTATALDPLLTLLGNGSLAPAAADALWGLVRLGALDDAPLARARVTVRQVLAAAAADAPVRPRLGRLLAFIGEAGDVEQVETMLDDPNDEVRSTVADGFSARGLHEPLLARAGDPAIYPAAVRVLADGTPDLERFRVLVDLAPPEGPSGAWSDAMRHLSGRLDAALLFQAEDILADANPGDVDLRVRMLGRAAIADGLPTNERIRVLLRLTPMLLEQGDAVRAFEHLEELNGLDEHGTLNEWKFRAALRAPRYDAATLIHAGPDEWIVVLIELAGEARTADDARKLHAQIEERFADRLDTEMRALLDATGARLQNGGKPPQATGDATPPDDGGATAAGGAGDDRP